MRRAPRPALVFLKKPKKESKKPAEMERVIFEHQSARASLGSFTTKEWSRSSARLISTGQLRLLPVLHPRPIDVVVYHGPNTTRVAET